ncbi:MAG: histidinol dehydrogenase [Haliscomenobacter sp.]
MKRFIYPEPAQWPQLLARPVLKTEDLERTVSDIIREVQTNGDSALRTYTARFDRVELTDLEVSANEIRRATEDVPGSLKTAIQIAYENITAFHRAQQTPDLFVDTMPGVRCCRKSRPIEKVGLYIPGGTAPLFSTVLMLGIPAVLAGCRDIVLCTPPDLSGSVNPVILYTAQLIGITRIFKIGGVQAIAAMAFGTESVPQVYKIFGPGNQYVTAAKQMVSRMGVAIDMPAGPSEVLVCADNTADPTFVAADLLSQAEHGIDSQVVLLAMDPAFIDQTEREINRLLDTLPRKDIARKALEHSLAIVPRDREEALQIINAYAPEHLILALKDVDTMADGVVNAGSVFLGNYTPEAAGDYASGTNHTLPTNGFARAFSGVSLDSFQKKITFQRVSQDGLRQLGPAVEAMAEAEQLEAHKLAIRVRMQTL